MRRMKRRLWRLSDGGVTVLGDFLADALAPMGAVRVRAMFGGFGVSLDGFSVGIIAEDILYLKADPLDVSRFEAEDLGAFIYEKGGRPVAMSYRQAPAAAMRDAEVLRDWMAGALAAAKKAKRQEPRRGPRTGLTRGW